MSQTRVVGFFKAAHKANQFNTVNQGAPRTAEHKHSINGYRGGKHRDCPECRRLHSQATSAWKAGKNRARIAQEKAERDARYARALEFLEDGCSYMEAALSAKVDYPTLIKRHPEYRNNREEFRKVVASISHNETLFKLHREIWQKGTP